MKVTLILPPTGQKTQERFFLPNLSLPVLAGRLRAKGIEVLQKDLEILFKRKLEGGWKGLNFDAVGDSARIAAYLRGKLPAGEACVLEELEERLFELGGLEHSDVFGISLSNLKSIFRLNCAALIAHRIKKLYAAPVIIGEKDLSTSVHKEILSRYPVFDFSVNDPLGGEEPLLRLLRRLSGDKSAVLAGTTERLPGGKFRTHPASASGPAVCPAPDYRGYPLELYGLTGREILAAYNCGAPVFRDVLRLDRRKKHRIVMTRFETTCRGACIFCPNNAALRSNRRPNSEVLAELKGLKAGGTTGIYFLNSQFNNNYKEAEELCDGMIKQRLWLQWCDCANFRELDEDLLVKMRDAGAVKLTFGMETGSPRLLRHIRKGSDLEKIQRLVRFSHSLGIWNHIELVGGMPTENDDDVTGTVEFIKANREFIDVYSLNAYYLFKTSPLYRAPERYGISVRPPRTRVDHLTQDDTLWREMPRYDERGGLSWEEKDRQIIGSMERITGAIKDYAPPVRIEHVPIHLLMYLYSVFGHENKQLIRKLVQIATTEARPHDRTLHASPTCEESVDLSYPARGGG